MSDLPPEESNPPQPAGSSETSPSVPHWAVPAAPPPIEPASEAQSAATLPAATLPAADQHAPSVEPVATDIPAWANDPAVAQVPPHWAAPGAGVEAPAPIPVVAATPAPGSTATNPPTGWYVPVPAAPGWAPPAGVAPGQPATTIAPLAGAGAPTGASAAPAQASAWNPIPSAAPAPMARTFPFNRARWLPTFVVAAIIAGVTLGGIGLDKVVAAPSAGTVSIGGSVTITAASGWVLVTPKGDTSGGIQLQKGNAVLTVQVVSTSYTGTSSAMVSDAERSLGGASAQISYGDVHHGSISGNDTSSVTFEATMTSGQQSGIVDGELVCMVVETNETIIVAAAPQGHLQPVIDDVSAMLKSVRVGQ
jgi:hypothetical protein